MQEEESVNWYYWLVSELAKPLKWNAEFLISLTNKFGETLRNIHHCETVGLSSVCYSYNTLKIKCNTIRLMIIYYDSHEYTIFSDGKCTKSVKLRHTHFFPLVLQPTSVTRSRTVGRTPWMGDQFVARPLPVHKHRKTAHTTPTLTIHALGGIRTHGLGVRTSEDSSWRHTYYYYY
jgi:hypothetical protein